MKYNNLPDFLDYVKARNPHQPEFLQAVQEGMGSLWGFIKANPHCADAGILERLVESERIIQFRVSWVDDHNHTHINRAFRIQHSSAIGPFKGGMRFEAGKNPWGVPVDIALPCATQNELHGDDTRELVKNGVKCVAESANMPSNLEAIEVFLHSKILYGPGKAANAGGVATSDLEMTQNAERLPWERHEVDARLRIIMSDIPAYCVYQGPTDRNLSGAVASQEGS